MKRIISIVLAAVMIVSMCGMAAFAVEPREAFLLSEVRRDGVYNLDDGGWGT